MEIGQVIKIIREQKGLTLSAVADAIPGYDAGNLSRFERGIQRADQHRIAQIAEQLGISVADLYAIAEERPIYQASNLEKVREPINRVPLLSWGEAGELCGMTTNNEKLNALDWMLCPAHVGPRAFALRVRGISMEPKYHDGDVIFVDPDIDAAHARNVVVKLMTETEPVFRQLVVEGDTRFLRTLNPDWPGPRMIALDEHAEICGVVVGKWVTD